MPSFSFSPRKPGSFRGLNQRNEEFCSSRRTSYGGEVTHGCASRPGHDGGHTYTRRLA